MATDARDGASTRTRPGMTPGPASPTIGVSGPMEAKMDDDAQSAINNLTERVQDLVADLDLLRIHFHEFEVRVNRLDYLSTQ